MLLRWIAVALLSGVLALPAWAEDVDAPLPFDDPSSAAVIAPKKPAKAIKANKPVVAKSAKKIAAKPAPAHGVKKPVARKKAR